MGHDDTNAGHDYSPLAAPIFGLHALVHDDIAIPKRVAAFRRVATKLLLIEQWVTLAPILVVGYFGHVSLIAIAVIGAMFALLSSYAYRSNPIGLATRYALAIGLLMNVLLLIYALSNSGSWQLDGGHMWIFAVWSHCLALLCWRSLVASGFLGVLHHFIMIYLVPAYVFPDGAYLGRVLLHAGVVIMQLGVLTVFISLIFRMLWFAENLERSLERNAQNLLEINLAKSKFLAMMSHELRTPLNAIIGFSEVMKEKIFGPMANDHYEEYAVDIHQSGTHLLEIINDLLDLSRIEAGKLEIALQPVAVEALTHDCLKLVAGVADVNGVKLLPPSFGGVAEVTADPRLMKQMIINLLSNACKYTPRNGQVRVLWSRQADAVSVSISDTGIGMSRTELDIALQPFGKVESALVKLQEGTGLGLPLVKSLIEAHGGELHIQTGRGAGSTFTLRLPQGLPPGISPGMSPGLAQTDAA